MNKKKIGKYDIEAVIGEGSFGKVYLGMGDNNEKVALKCIAKRGRTMRQINNLKSEAQLLTKIKHQNVIGMRQCFQNEQEIIVVMEYAGTDLSKLLQKQKKLPQEKVRFLGRQILSAMLYLHQNRILHRDLKPQNILLHKDTIKICDFGFAKKMSASTNFLMSIKGTPLYIAPQILQNKPYNHKVDVWSLGIILYELLYSRTPFYASTIQQLQPKILHDQVKFNSTSTQISPVLRDLIDGMLQKSEAKRFDWEQVKNHKFFTIPDSIPSMINQAKTQKKIEEKQQIEECKPKICIVWNAEEECAEITRIESEFASDKLQIRDLRGDSTFSLRVAQLMGQACIDRAKIPKQILLKTIKMIIKLLMAKDVAINQEDDLARNKQLMSAVISLALQQTDEDLLPFQLQIIGFMLKHNFDKIKIDTDYDDQITTIISKQLTRPCSRISANYCFKVLGILAGQAICTLSHSQQFFQRIAQQKLLTVIANCYTPSPQDAIVLQCLQKFIHPLLERTITLTNKTKNLFKLLKEEVAGILLTKGFIEETCPISKAWLKGSDIQIYCQILLECLTVSKQVRAQFLKRDYWKQFGNHKRTKLSFIAFCYILVKQNQQNICASNFLKQYTQQEGAIKNNKLPSLYLLYLANFNIFSKHTKPKVQKLKMMLNNVKDLLGMSQDIKSQNTKELFGYFNQGSQYFDAILIDIIQKTLKSTKEEQIWAIGKNMVEKALSLPLSEHSFLQVIELLQMMKINMTSGQIKRFDQYFNQMLKKDGFDGFLCVNPQQCCKLLTKLLIVQQQKLNDDKQIFNMIDLIDKFQLLRLLFSQQLLNEDLLLVTLRIVNKIFSKSYKFHDFLVTGGLSSVRKFYKTNNEQLKVQILIFCSSLARIKPQICKQLLDTGIVSVCFKMFGDGSETVKQKALHLIGNLSKHNCQAFQQFQKYHIVSCIHKCVNQHKDNRKILKNTIYAVGNISYYSQKFAKQIKPIIRYLVEGLSTEDDHLMLNTISTISNLLRHSDVHLSTLIETGAISRVVNIFVNTKSQDQANYCSNLFKKAIAFPQFLKVQSKTQLKTALDAHLSKGILRNDNEGVRKMKQLLA